MWRRTGNSCNRLQVQLSLAFKSTAPWGCIHWFSSKVLVKWLECGISTALWEPTQGDSFSYEHLLGFCWRKTKGEAKTSSSSKEVRLQGCSTKRLLSWSSSCSFVGLSILVGSSLFQSFHQLCAAVEAVWPKCISDVVHDAHASTFLGLLVWLWLSRIQ